MSKINAKLWLTVLATDRRNLEALREHVRSLEVQTKRPEMELAMEDLGRLVEDVQSLVKLTMDELTKGTE